MVSREVSKTGKSIVIEPMRRVGAKKEGTMNRVKSCRHQVTQVSKVLTEVFKLGPQVTGSVRG